MATTRFLLLLAALLPLLPLSVNADSTCSTTQKCPSTAPCCSEFGHCGSGTFCLGGCNPFSSFSPTSCAPMPICQSGNYTFDTADRIANASVYNNDPTNVDWTLDQGQVLATAAGELVLPMTDVNGTGLTNKGTRLSSTRQVHYGTITARIKTGHWAGVVIAFITMSDSKDEIDWEFPGTDVRTGQTNWFGLGDTDGFTHGGNASISTDSSANYHDYTFDWQPDALRWLIDGKVVRTLTKVSTLDKTTGRYKYPQMPSRVQLSIWGGGIPGNAPGTISWAGGLINWSDPQYVQQGYFWGLVDSVSIQCTADPNMPAGTVSYRYGDNDTTTGQPTVQYSTDATVIYSQRGTGLDMDAGKGSGAAGAGANGTNGIIGAATRSAGPERIVLAAAMTAALLAVGTLVM